MKRLYRSIYILSLIIVFSSTGFCQTIETVTIATPSWKNLTNRDGTGLYFDLFRMIYDSPLFKLNFVIVPWKRGKVMLMNQSADIQPAAYQTPATTPWIYSEYPMDVDYTVAVFKKSQIKKWSGQKSMKGRKVVWPRDYNFHNYLDVKVKWEEIDYPNQGWLMIESDRTDFYMDILPAINAYIRKHNPDMRIFNVETVLTINTYPRFFSSEKGKTLRDFYDKKASVLFGNGEIKRLFKKWNIKYPPFKMPKESE